MPSIIFSAGRVVPRLVTLALLAALTQALLLAQVDTGAISGTVLDAVGASISGAVVEITNEATGFTAKLVTNEAGFYSAPALRPGEYRVSVTKEGFAPQSRPGVGLRVQDRLALDFRLGVGAVNEEVAVTADVRLESESTSLGHVVTGKTVADLPLNGRGFIQLALLGAGTLPARGGNERDSFIANGARPEQNAYYLDGVNNRQRIVGSNNSTAQTIQPVLDSIQEFKVQTAGYSAEFGQAAGGVVNVTIKSGTNGLHGSAFEFHRNSAVSATPYFQPAGGGKPKFLQNQFGATLGGPVVKNRTFFFAGWQSSRNLSAAPQIATVPTADMLAGKFGATKIYDPATTTANPGGGFVRAAFENNIIPQSRWDPVAAKLLTLFPKPNLPSSTNNFFYNPTQRVYNDQGDARVDHRFSDRDSLFIRFSATNGRNTLPGALPDPAAQTSVARPAAYSVAGGETHVFTASGIVNELRFGYFRTSLVQEPLAERLFESYGFKGTFPESRVTGLPIIQITGFTKLGTSGRGSTPIPATGSDNLPIDKLGHVFQILDNVSLVRGRHSLKAGVDIERSQMGAFTTLSARPTISFNGIYTQDPQNRSTTGAAFADFLLGLSNRALTSTTNDATLRQYIYQFYFQDDWKATSRLTVNLGVRYELVKPYQEVSDKYSNFVVDPGPLFGKYVLAAEASRYGYNRSLVGTDYNNVAPRVGVAYQLTPKTVVRSAFGVFFGRADTLGLSGHPTNNPPFFIRSNLVGDQIQPNFTLAAGFPAGIHDPATVVNPQVNSFPRSFPTPYVLQWNLNVQRELPGGLVAQLGYVGSQSHKLYDVYDVNQPSPGPGSVQSRRPIKGVSNVHLNAPVTNANYNSLFAQLEKRYSNGLSFLVSYTLGHSIDNGQDPAAQYAFDLAANRGDSSYDVRHRVVTSYTWELPFGPGRRFAHDGGLLSHLVGGWTVSGIFSAQTGLPFTPTLNFDPSNTGATARPNRVRDGNLPADRRTVSRWFDTAAFVAPTGFAFGNSGRSVLRGPGFVNFDAALARGFKLSERVQAQFRAEAFNLTNTPQFGLPNAVIGTQQAGVISTVVNPERQLQFALRLSF